MSLPEDKRAAAAQGMLHAWWAARIPERLALVTPHGDRTYEDLNHDINRLCRALRARARPRALRGRRPVSRAHASPPPLGAPRRGRRWW